MASSGRAEEGMKLGRAREGDPLRDRSLLQDSRSDRQGATGAGTPKAVPPGNSHQSMLRHQRTALCLPQSTAVMQPSGAMPAMP